MDDLIKTLYEKFGLAYYLSECLHKQLCLIYTLCDFKDTSMITESRVEKKLQYSFSLTLGKLTKDVLDLIPNKYKNELSSAIKKRNYLAHYFWFEKVNLMFSEGNIIKLINELDGYIKCFEEIDAKLTSEFKNKFIDLGMSEAIVDDSLNSIINGEPYVDLPKKRKLKKREVIISAWEFRLPDGNVPLLFEADDHELWEFCDIGLGWTKFEKVEADWIKNPIISQYLPATINPRPRIIKPWSYEFTLSKNVIIWVEKSQKERKFKWGIKK